MKKIKLDNLTNEMIKILLIDLEKENATKDSKTIDFKHYNKDLVIKLLSKARAKYSLEWGTDIIRDEVYATVYEAMDIVAKDIESEDINLNNKAFVGPTYNLAAILLKDKLIPESKKQNGKVLEFQEVAASQLGVNEDGQALTIEDILSTNIIEQQECKMNNFLIWFNNNKSKILTKKQQQFLNGEIHYTDRRTANQMRKRISDKVSYEYDLKYNNVSPRIANLMDQQEVIEKILDAKDFKKEYEKYRDEDFIIDTVVADVSLKTLKEFNNGSKENNIIKEIKIALFKKLEEINNLINIAK